MKFITDNIISLLSLLISCASFVYNYLTNKFNLKIRTKTDKVFCDSNDVADNYNLILDTTFENRSKYPISIIKIKFNKYLAFDKEIFVRGGGGLKFDKPFRDEQKTFNLPLALSSFECKKGILSFSDNKPLKIYKFNILTIYTTRGKKYKIVKYPFLLNNKQIQ